MVVRVSVKACLDYCNALYVELPLKMVQKLQLVQNGIAQLVAGAWHAESGMLLLQGLY